VLAAAAAGQVNSAFGFVIENQAAQKNQGANAVIIKQRVIFKIPMEGGY
jgi:hypothetical protein